MILMLLDTGGPDLILFDIRRIVHNGIVQQLTVKNIDGHVLPVFQKQLQSLAEGFVALTRKTEDQLGIRRDPVFVIKPHQALEVLERHIFTVDIGKHIFAEALERERCAFAHTGVVQLFIEHKNVVRIVFGIGGLEFLRITGLVVSLDQIIHKTGVPREKAEVCVRRIDVFDLMRGKPIDFGTHHRFVKQTHPRFDIAPVAKSAFVGAAPVGFQDRREQNLGFRPQHFIEPSVQIRGNTLRDTHDLFRRKNRFSVFTVHDIWDLAELPLPGKGKQDAAEALLSLAELNDIHVFVFYNIAAAVNLMPSEYRYACRPFLFHGCSQSLVIFVIPYVAGETEHGGLTERSDYGFNGVLLINKAAEIIVFPYRSILKRICDQRPCSIGKIYGVPVY